MMKKTALYLALVLSVSMAAACTAEEPENGTNAAVGSWYNVGLEGGSLGLPSGAYYVFPDGSVTNHDENLGVSLILADDGSFTVDTAGIEELADYTVTGEIMPLSEESLAQYKVNKGANSWVNYSEDSKQLILTVSYPDPKNPLATSPAVTTVYFLRGNDQSGFVKEFMSGKTWKIGDHVLEIDAEGNMNLNDGAATGRFRTNPDETSQYISATVLFSWDKGDTIKYAPVLVGVNTIKLQNLDKPDEILELDCMGAGEAAEPDDPAQEEEAAEPVAAAEEAETVEPVAAEEETVEAVDAPETQNVDANPFVGTWEVDTVSKNGTEIPAKELLQSDSMTATYAEDGELTLRFSNGFSVSMKPDNDGTALTVRYTEFNNDMTWTAVHNDDDTITASYEDLAITLIRQAQ